MTEKYNNKYRIASTRAQWWNYGWAAAYFITICTKNRLHYFGEIKKQEMVLSQVGVLADVFWNQLPQHFNQLELGAYVIMPNHMHGLLIINSQNAIVNNGHDDFINTNDNADMTDIPDIPVETRHALSLQSPQSPQSPQPPGNLGKSRFQNQGKNTVSAMVGSYKSAVKRQANRLGLEFFWQSNFHDHIVRDDSEYQRINDYIENYPLRWHSDKFYRKKR